MDFLSSGLTIKKKKVIQQYHSLYAEFNATNKICFAASFKIH